MESIQHGVRNNSNAIMQWFSGRNRHKDLGGGGGRGGLRTKRLTAKDRLDGVGWEVGENGSGGNGGRWRDGSRCKIGATSGMKCGGNCNRIEKRVWYKGCV